MTENIRQDETKGSVDERLMVLENSLLNRWDRWFGKNPGVVLGIVVFTLASGGWVFHTYQLDYVKKDYESRISWLKEQNALALKNGSDKCSIEKNKIQRQWEKCRENNITNQSSSQLSAAGTPQSGAPN
jgi:hypothetical protein